MLELCKEGIVGKRVIVSGSRNVSNELRSGDKRYMMTADQRYITKEEVVFSEGDKRYAMIDNGIHRTKCSEGHCLRPDLAIRPK
jgi:hypothetical protein